MFLRNDKVFLCSVLRLLVTANVVSSLPILVPLMMEAIHSFETSVLKSNIPEDGILPVYLIARIHLLTALLLNGLYRAKYSLKTKRALSAITRRPLQSRDAAYLGAGQLAASRPVRFPTPVFHPVGCHGRSGVEQIMFLKYLRTKLFKTFTFNFCHEESCLLRFYAVWLL
jgi:hypothetical protein